MRICFVTDSGCEEACRQELQQLTDKKIAIGKNIVQLDCALKEALAISYRIRTARRAFAQLARTEDDMLGKPDPETLRQTMEGTTTWKVDAEVLRIGPEGHDLGMDGHEITEHIAGWISGYLEGDVRLENPDRTVYALRTTECLRVGIDIAGKLSKRDWRIMLSRRSLKATIAAAAAVYADLSAGQTVLDPIADDGTLAIEAALLLTGTSPRKHQRSFLFSHIDGWRENREQDILPIIAMCETLKDLKAVRMNSKLAGVSGAVQSTRVTIDWIDLKIEEGSVDRILSYPRSSGKALRRTAALNALDDFCNQAAWLLKPGGKMICVMRKPDELLGPAGKHGFSLIKEQKVLMGKLPMSILCFEAV